MIAQNKGPLIGKIFLGAAIFAALASFTMARAQDDDDDASTFVSTGQKITPTAAPQADFQLLNPGLTDFPNFIPSGALSSVFSPVRQPLLVLISGHNVFDNAASKVVPADSTQYILVFDVSTGKPSRKKETRSPNTFPGVASN